MPEPNLPRCSAATITASWIELPGIKETKGRDKWSFPSPPHLAHTKTITIDPRDPNVIYAGVEQGDLLKTTDGGANWRVLDKYWHPDDWTYRDIHLLVVHPSNSAELYMTTGMGLHRSFDAGETWDLLVDNSFRIGYPDQLIVSPLDGDTMFMAGASKNPGTWRTSRSAETTVQRTRDRGVTWTDTSSGLPEIRRANVEAMSVTAYPNGFALLVGNTDGDVFASEDQAESWTRIATGLAPVSKGNHYRALQPAWTASRPMARSRPLSVEFDRRVIWRGGRRRPRDRPNIPRRACFPGPRD